MKTPQQIAKIKAVLLYIMQNFHDGVDYIKLFKILYFAQQDHLVRYGKVIVDDSFRALKHGPVPTYTYKALQIAEGKPLEGDFDEFLSNISVRDKKVYTTALPDMDYISGADRKCLDAAIAKYKDTDPYDLSDLSHDAAWMEAISRVQDDPQKNFITLIDIARAGCASEPMVDYIREKQIVKNALS
ncbi:MAG: Panacea domain-containing protein [Paenibacillus sp.]|nr:Panacea domain-containing protein [Paenibacillus sp.]